MYIFCKNSKLFYCRIDHFSEVNHILVSNIYWPFWPPVQVIKKCHQKVVLLRPFWFWFKSKFYHTVLGKWQSTRSIQGENLYIQHFAFIRLEILWHVFQCWFVAIWPFDQSMDRSLDFIYTHIYWEWSKKKLGISGWFVSKCIW